MQEKDEDTNNSRENMGVREVDGMDRDGKRMDRKLDG